MTDFATLGMVIDSSQVKKGVGDLDQLTAAGARAEGSVDKLGASTKGAAASAAAYASSVQTMARNTTAFGTATATAGAASGLARVQLLELSHVATSLSGSLVAGQNPVRALALELPRIAQAAAFGGAGIKGLISQLAQMTGIIKVTRDAELAEQAANASSAAQALKGAAERAAANIATTDTEIALAEAAVRTAATSEALKAAHERLAKAHAAVAAAASEATIAERALAEAQGRAAAASEASNAKTVIGLGRVGIALGVFATVAGVAYAGFKSFQDQVAQSGELDKFAEGLRLTDAQIEAAGGKVKYLGDRTREITGLTVSFGDVAKATFQVLAEGAGTSAKGISDAFSATFKWIGDFGKFTIAVLLSGFTALVELIASTAKNLGRLATGQLDKVTNPLKDMKDQFFKTFDQVNAGFDKIGNRAKKLAEDKLQAESDSNKPPKAPKARKQSDHGLADALAELDAQIKGQNALAAAYQVSDAAAVKAEAMQKAEEQAIRHKGETALFYEKELALAVATRAADGAKTIGALAAQTAAQKALNDQVADGTITAAQAAVQLKDEAQVRPLITAQTVASEQAAKSEGKAKAYWLGIVKQLTPEIARLRLEQAKSNDEANRAQVLADTAQGQKELDRLKLETSLIGASNRERAKALAYLAAQQYLEAHPTATSQNPSDIVTAQEHAREYAHTVAEVAVATADLQTATDKYNASLSYTADLMSLLNDRAQQVANTLSDAFGNVGQGLGQAITALSGYAAQQAKLDQQHQAAIKAGLSDEKEVDLYRQASLNNQLAGTAQVIAGLKTMFKEHSVGYRAMEAAEKAFAVIQAINTIKNVAAGAAKMFATLGPFAFPAVAAMIAVMAGLGFGGGGGSQTAPTSSQDLQDAAGTGTVLGSPKDKSASIANSLAIVAKNTDTDLVYSNQMLIALRSIDNSIGDMAASVAKQFGVGGVFDTSSLNLGTNSHNSFSLLGGLLGGVLGGIFGGKKTTTTSLFDQGLQFGNQSIGSIIASGIQGSVYDVIQSVTKKSGFLGIGGSTKTSYSTTTSALDPGIAASMQQVIAALENGLVTAANTIGLQGAKAMLDGFQVSIGKISFNGLDAQGIQDELNAVFSSIGDQMATKLLPSLASMQKAGEGLFETFVRVAKEYETVDVELQSIGKTFGAVGVGSIQARDALVQLFGGLDEFTSATDNFRSQFLTDAEQIAPVQAAVIAQMQALGVSGVTTREQFKNLVLGLDLTTDAGRQMYASLLAVAPAFDKVLDYFDNANKAMADSLSSTVEQFNNFASSLQKYRDTLFQTDAAQGNAYQTLKKAFIATANLAATGDATALGGLQDAGKNFLTASRDNASTLQDYLRDVALVAKGVDNGIAASKDAADYAQLQLDALTNATSILQQISANTAATAAAIAQPVAAPVPSNPTPAPADPQVVSQNQTIINQNGQIITLLTDQQRLWRRFDGDGLLVRTDADTPIQTQVVA